MNPGREIYSLNIIGGLDSDYEGSVQISGRNIKDLKGKELDEYRKMNIGFVFQSFNLIPGYTVIENVLVPTDMTTMSKKKKEESIESALHAWACWV